MPQERVTVLGLGAMGGVLAGSLLDAGHAVTVWNRTARRAEPLVHRGASGAATVRDAVTASPVVVACLFDHASVHDTLEPVVDGLAGRTLINLTTTTPSEARELAGWAKRHGIDYLDGAIMATPPMIGAREASILYSGSRDVFDRNQPILDGWATSTYDGDDPGIASLYDLALLSGMYQMFTGFLHGAAMVRSAGVSSAEFARRATPFLGAMTAAFAAQAEVLDAGDYSDPPQSLTWTATALDTIARASRESGADPAPITVIRKLVTDQIEAGHGDEDLDRIFEGLRTG
ncbi:NAD(P)-dependent oxidoreductase [Prauserella flavalba]|uniref:6-phosphogluconate dehydrogenase n=1 Tax=Prauserella flavalba TaxID=1477506 RepID=A0A318LNQ5_9PSEU|nr:NAD(P)-binding domain-containing protein [Prauserella flavalba]PXY34045.1 6-phosphogluconate dehydrogenase [Prauserella flavalba]